MDACNKVLQASLDAVQHMRRRTKRFFSLKPVEQTTRGIATNLYHLEGKVRNIFIMNVTKQNTRISSSETVGNTLYINKNKNK